MNHIIPATRNPSYGFYGTLSAHGYDADAAWQMAVETITRTAAHDNREDAAMPMAERIAKAADSWMRRRLESWMIRRGAPQGTPYLTAALRFAAEEAAV